jgi:hypothetical protein
LSESDNSWGSAIMSCCCEKLVAEARDSLGTQKKGNIYHWKLLPNNSSEDMIVDTCVSVCVIVKCNV